MLLVLTQEREGLAGVGDAVGEDDGVSSLQNPSDQRAHRPLKHLALAAVWAQHLQDMYQLILVLILVTPKEHMLVSTRLIL